MYLTLKDWMDIVKVIVTLYSSSCCCRVIDEIKIAQGVSKVERYTRLGTIYIADSVHQCDLSSIYWSLHTVRLS